MNRPTKIFTAAASAFAAVTLLSQPTQAQTPAVPAANVSPDDNYHQPGNSPLLPLDFSKCAGEEISRASWCGVFNGIRAQGREFLSFPVKKDPDEVREDVQQLMAPVHVDYAYPDEKSFQPFAGGQCRPIMLEPSEDTKILSRGAALRALFAGIDEIPQVLRIPVRFVPQNDLRPSAPPHPDDYLRARVAFDRRNQDSFAGPGGRSWPRQEVFCARNEAEVRLVIQDLTHSIGYFVLRDWVQRYQEVDDAARMAPTK